MPLWVVAIACYCRVLVIAVWSHCWFGLIVGFGLKAQVDTVSLGQQFSNGSVQSMVKNHSIITQNVMRYMNDVKIRSRYDLGMFEVPLRDLGLSATFPTLPPHT